MKNIHNVVTDVQEKVSADHFLVTGNVPGDQCEWTVVEFTADHSLLRFEVHLANQVSCVLEQVGFTNNQRDTIMEIFTHMMFD